VEAVSGGESVLVQGVEVPVCLYGTAWKEERTEALVGEALAAGFRGIDTANQRKHYDEAAVGAALATALGPKDGARGLARADLFLQTKFTYVEGQDERLPYDPAADVPTQVRQSLASSLDHLGVERLDSFLLHGPRTRAGLSPDDRELWRTFEELQAEGRARLLGASNVTAEQLAALCDFAAAPPAFVQNRCFARLGWDREVRRVCRQCGVVYQGFSLLTANRAELASPEVRRIAARHGVSVAQTIFRFARQLGMICLTGTTDAAHMREDLELGFTLAEEEVRVIEGVSG
jgi:diketogulonate reductase-like aldo/keto reductase